MQLIVDGAEHNFSGQELRRPLRVYSVSVPDADGMITITVNYDRVVEVAVIRLIEGGTNALGQVEAQLLVDGKWQPVPAGTALSQLPDSTIPYQLIDFQLPTPILAQGIQLIGKIQEDARFPEASILELDALSK
jgi:hypothetical protein